MKSPLGRVAGPAPANTDELDALRRRAWQERGFLVIDAADGRLDPAQRAFITSIGERIFGGRGSHDWRGDSGQGNGGQGNGGQGRGQQGGSPHRDRQVGAATAKDGGPIA